MLISLAVAKEPDSIVRGVPLARAGDHHDHNLLPLLLGLVQSIEAQLVEGQHLQVAHIEAQQVLC